MKDKSSQGSVGSDKLYTGDHLQWPDGVYVGVSLGAIAMIVRHAGQTLTYGPDDSTKWNTADEWFIMKSKYRRIADA